MKILNFSLLFILLSGIKAYSQAPVNWTVNPGSYNHSMQVTCKLNQACVDLADPNNKVAAFVNGVCRGVAYSDVSVSSDYLALLVIYSNSVAGETIRFAFYNASTNTVINGIDSLVFNSGSQVGGLTSPYIVTDNHAPTNIIISDSSFVEDITSNGVVGSLSTTDDAGSTFAYSLAPGVLDNNDFGINGSDLVAGSSFDYESDSVKTVEITVTDNGGCTLTKTFQLTILDVNENPTALNLALSLISDHQQSDSQMGIFSTVDPDLIENFTYTLVPGTGDADNSQFYIQNDTLFNVSQIEYAVQSSYSIRARSTDKGGLFIENIFTINVTNTNDAPTDIIPGNDTVSENLPVGTTIGTLSAIDADPADTHTFDLVSGTGSTHNASVTIVGNELKTNAVLNFEQTDTLFIRIQTKDPFNATYTKTFNILVIDRDDTPTDITLSNDSILEGLPAGTFVGEFTSTDEDVPSSFTYTLVNGTGDADNSLFSVSGDSLVSAQTYYYSGQSYNIRIRTTDSTGLFYEEAFVIGVRDSNYVPTDIIPSLLSFNENIAIGTSISVLSTTDYDSTDTHVYSFAGSSADTAYFKITGNEILTDSTINFEIKSSYSISIKTTDPYSASFTKSFVFSALDVNEAPTDIALSNNTVEELKPAGEFIGTFSSVDEDGGATHTYSLVMGTGDTDNALFTISGNQLLSAANFTYSGQTYSIRVASTDNGGLSFEEVFNITILNVNEAPTDILIDTLQISEDNDPMFFVSTIRTTDKDIPDSFTYQLVTGEGDADNDQFTVEGDRLYINDKTNFDVKNSYKFRISTTDLSGTSFEKSFELQVLDLEGNSIPLPSTNYVSPNGDGKNDYWKIENVEVYKYFSLQIFDHFGHVIHSVESNYSNDWDAKLNGIALPPGNYYYVFKNDKVAYKGNITVVNN